MQLFETIGRVYKEVKEDRRKRKEAKRRFKIAYTFNAYYTHWTRMYVPMNKGFRGRWMCPSCNTTHDQIDFSVLTGRLFPACCEFEEGHRIYDFHAAP